jgi:hypothetical protein
VPHSAPCTYAGSQVPAQCSQTGTAEFRSCLPLLPVLQVRIVLPIPEPMSLLTQASCWTTHHNASVL